MNDVPQSSSERKWVWHSTLASRAAGQISVLACGETIFAVALYWWIALRFETHWHLLSSVFIAPLLLLRSPESMAAGVRWFANDWFGFGKYRDWPVAKKAVSNTTLIIIFGAVTFVLVRLVSIRSVPKDLFLSQHSLSFLAGLLYSWLSYATASALSISIRVSFPLGLALAGAFLIAVLSAGLPLPWTAFAGYCAGSWLYVGSRSMSFLELTSFASAASRRASNSAKLHTEFKKLISSQEDIITSNWSTETFTDLERLQKVEAMASSYRAMALDLENKTYSLAVKGTGFILPLGYAIRAILCRVAATVRYGVSGISSVPENWRETIFLTDSFIPAELIPGIRDRLPLFALDGLWQRRRRERDWFYKWIGYLCGALFLFAPAFLYRLNIKATSWFWWQLAYLLKPPPVTETEGQQKQALCWPWTDPFQRFWIIGSILLATGSIAILTMKLAAYVSLPSTPAFVQIAKIWLAMDWSEVAPWHRLQWFSAVLGAVMLVIAGKAQSNAANNNWGNYPFARNHFLMTWLSRLRRLATMVWFLMCLLYLSWISGWLPTPWFQTIGRPLFLKPD